MTAVIEDLDVAFQEMLDEAKICENTDEKCASHHKAPATYFMTHEGASPGCTKLLCEPCVFICHIVFRWADDETKGIVVCATCRKRFHHEDVTIRPL